MKKLIILSVFMLSMPVSSLAQTEKSEGFLGVLALAKMTGACGAMDSMINLQKTTQLEGGDKFVTRFWEVEAARLGLTLQELSDECNKSISAYNKLWNTIEHEQE